MSNDLNSCSFIGRLGHDPEAKTLPSGSNVTNFSIAVGSSWKDKDSGEKKERVEWVAVVIYGKLGEIAAQYLTKGKQVHIRGEMRTRKWQDKDGKDRYTTEVVADRMQMLGDKPAGESARTEAPAAAAKHTPASGDKAFEDDDIPF